MPNATDLRNALGLNDLGGATKPKETTGAGALQRDLQQAFDEGRGSNALRPTQMSGSQQYSVPWSTSPIEMPEQGSTVQSPTYPKVSMPTFEAPQISSSQPEGLSSATGTNIGTSPISVENVLDALIPEYNTTNASNAEYERYLAEIPEEDRQEIVQPSGYDWANAIVDANPLIGMAANALGLDNVSYGDALQFAEDRGYKNPLKDVANAVTGFFGTDKADDARTPDNATSPWATGEAMQKYGEMGMGGRDWWRYDPNAMYNKADEEQDFGFRPYLPDTGSRLGMAGSQFLDAFGDVAGAVSQGRKFLTNDLPEMLGFDSGYVINDKGRKIDGEDWDAAATPYVNNMRKILEHNPELVLKRPEGDRIHGAPVSIKVMEYAIPNVDGGMSYLHGEYAGGDYNEDGTLRLNNDGSMRMYFTDGQSVDVPESVWSTWETVSPDGELGLEIPFPDMSSYVQLENARGFLPEDLDSLNERAISEKDYTTAPVLYMPNLTLDDGTQVTWDEAQQIYSDRNRGENGISYDFGPLGLARPQRLNNQLLDEEGWHPETFFNNAVDYTLGSLPIMINKIAWPISLAQAAGKSAMGIDPGKYDPITGSDQYIAADLDENGHIEPTYTTLQQMANIAGNALTPKLEEMAGPMSGHSWAEKNLIKDTIAPSLRRLWGNFMLDAFGEGVEELFGNVVDELSGQADAAYGNPITPSGERMLDANGNPVVDSEGNYRFVNGYGEPMTSWMDETGHVYKDPNTPLQDRLRNAIDFTDAFNTIVGGMQVAGLLGGPRTIARSPAAIRGDIMEHRLGMRPYVPTEWDKYMLDPDNNPEPEIVEMDPRFMKYFSNELPEEEM